MREHADRFRARAAEFEWIPAFMRRRLEDWIDGLKWDWNITRQRRRRRSCWFCTACAAPVLARLEDLPVDPLADKPPVASCPSCGSALEPDPDVMDTWMTSSLTPQINDGWAIDGNRPRAGADVHAGAGVRDRRTWLFYSVVQSELHFGRVPWRTALISGWGLTEQGKKLCTACAAPVLARLEDLPVDPLADKPPVTACPACGSALEPDPDVMDTWMTSSLTPQINDGWAVGGTDPALAPMSMRVQAFEIIRTWLFYSVVQSELHFGRVPWRTALISGWGLSEQGKKLSKRDLDKSTGADGYNRYVPDDVMAKYGADALRLWATKGRIGTDLRYNEKDIRTGRKFAVKLWNVGRFLSLNLGDLSGPAPAPAERDIVDRWLLSHLADAVTETTAAFEAHDYMQAHQAASRMFWSIYCDRYLEMIKDRLTASDGLDADSARWTLWESFRVLLGLFAPFAPFVTERMYQQFYRAHEDEVSLHLTRWPVVDERWRGDRSAVDQLAVILDATRVLRSGQRLGNSARLSQLIVQAHDARAQALLDQIAEPLRVAARADAVVRGPAEHASGVAGITVGIAV